MMDNNGKPIYFDGIDNSDTPRRPQRVAGASFTGTASRGG